MKNVEEFIQEYYPNYSGSNEIAREQDLFMIMNEEEEDDSIADNMLRNEYDWNREHAKIDWIELRMKIMEAAIEGYLAEKLREQIAYQITSSWGEVYIDKFGNILEIDGDEVIDGTPSYLYQIAKFDVERYEEFCEYIGRKIHGDEDIFFMGFWLKNGTYQDIMLDHLDFTHGFNITKLPSIGMVYHAEKQCLLPVTPRPSSQDPENIQNVIDFSAPVHLNDLAFGEDVVLTEAEFATLLSHIKPKNDEQEV